MGGDQDGQPVGQDQGGGEPSEDWGEGGVGEAGKRKD